MSVSTPAKSRFHLLLSLAVPALAALCALAWQTTTRGSLPLPPPPADIAAFDRRMAPLCGILRDAGPVGYWTDPGRKSVRSVKEFMLTQYALAPVIVAEGTDRAWVVGNFHGSLPGEEELRRKRLVVKRDFGGGIVLYAKQP